MSAFEKLSAIPPQLLTDGYLARAVHGAELTLAVVEIEPGAALPEHHHVNEQFGIVIEGSVTFQIGDEEQVLGPGGIWRIASDTAHSVAAGDAGAVVVDVFSPPRDWPESEVLAPRRPVWP